MVRVLVQFDGGNFYKRVKSLDPTCHLSNFDYQGFVGWLTKKQPAIATYYVGEIRRYPGCSTKTQSLYSNQQSLFTHFRQQNINIQLGYLLQSNGVYHEKGVDVKIAVDMVLGAVKDVYDIYYLLSSDTDLLPAIKAAQAAGKKVIYVGFENNSSKAMKNTCSSTIILKQSDLKPFCQ